MHPNEPIVQLIERVRAGDTAAAEVLFTRYSAHLTRLAERHLNARLAARLDGDDVVQSVFRTFFRRCLNGEFTIDTSSQLWRLLLQVTLRKVAEEARHAAREPRASPAEDDWLVQAVSREPGPTEATVLVDQIESLMRGLPHVFCQILELRLAGHSVAEVAATLQVSRQTVYRCLRTLAQRLERVGG